MKSIPKAAIERVGVLRDGVCALYRPLYLVRDFNSLLHDTGSEYQGFQPTFETDINDLVFTTGKIQIRRV